jgi:hypothetical protein
MKNTISYQYFYPKLYPEAHAIVCVCVGGGAVRLSDSLYNNIIAKHNSLRGISFGFSQVQQRSKPDHTSCVHENRNVETEKRDGGNQASFPVRNRPLISNMHFPPEHPSP